MLQARLLLLQLLAATLKLMKEERENKTFYIYDSP